MSIGDPTYTGPAMVGRGVDIVRDVNEGSEYDVRINRMIDALENYENTRNKKAREYYDRRDRIDGYTDNDLFEIARDNPYTGERGRGRNAALEDKPELQRTRAAVVEAREQARDAALEVVRFIIEDSTDGAGNISYESVGARFDELMAALAPEDTDGNGLIEFSEVVGQRYRLSLDGDDDAFASHLLPFEESRGAFVVPFIIALRPSDIAALDIDYGGDQPLSPGQMETVAHLFRSQVAESFPGLRTLANAWLGRTDIDDWDGDTPPEVALPILRAMVYDLFDALTPGGVDAIALEQDSFEAGVTDDGQDGWGVNPTSGLGLPQEFAFEIL
ncbi:MAG: hypothetical protein AAF658_22245, partial [Myxococcota bacterium]